LPASAAVFPVRAVSGLTRIVLLGATGSIGASTLDVMRRPGPSGEIYRPVALTAMSNLSELVRLSLDHRPELAVIGEEALLPDLRSALSGTGVRCAGGAAGLLEAAETACECVVSAIVGIAGLPPTLAAVRQGRAVALANKESLVCAGDLLRHEAELSGARLIPIDSEHNAIFQVLNTPQRVEKLILTASGGPFRTWSRQEMERARPADALRHPNWRMGAKISVDSATMMNKGLELIEAVHLFSVPPGRIDVLVHPQSIIHSLVAYDDGSVLAQLGLPDMRTPISFAIAFPGRMALPGLERLDLVKVGRLDFEAPDAVRFPALSLARAAAESGGRSCIGLNGANEAAVAAFLQERIGFLGIAEVVRDVLERLSGASGDAEPSGFEEVFAIDAQTRAYAEEAIGRLAR